MQSLPVAAHNPTSLVQGSASFASFCVMHEHIWHNMSGSFEFQQEDLTIVYTSLLFLSNSLLCLLYQLLI